MGLLVNTAIVLLAAAENRPCALREQHEMGRIITNSVSFDGNFPGFETILLPWAGTGVSIRAR